MNIPASKVAGFTDKLRHGDFLIQIDGMSGKKGIKTSFKRK